MNSLEERIANLNLTWVQSNNIVRAFYASHQEFNFAVYCRNDRTWLCILDKNFELPEVVNVYGPLWDYRTLLEIPVSKTFYVHVLESAYPEMLAL